MGNISSETEGFRVRNVTLAMSEECYPFPLGRGDGGRNGSQNDHAISHDGVHGDMTWGFRDGEERNLFGQSWYLLFGGRLLHPS